MIEPKVFNDERGFFAEVYKSSEFAEFGIKDNFSQDNQSKSIYKGTLRGLHFQKKAKAQAKLIWVLKGGIFDVAVDIRKGSPTYGKWVSASLSAENKHLFYIPAGFAHGYCTLEDNTEIIYKCSNEYSPADDRGIIWNDRDININWPIVNPTLSLKDRNLPSLRDADCDFVYV